MKKILSTKYQENTWSLGLLILRVGIGLLMLRHGMDKLTHFNEYKGMSVLFGSPTDMILVIFAEFFCSIFLVLGLFTRFAVIPLVITMAVAFFKTHHSLLSDDCKLSGESALVYLLVYLTILFTGPGKFSIDRMIAK
jgi:putative oxidoreductase